MPLPNRHAGYGMHMPGQASTPKTGYPAYGTGYPQEVANWQYAQMPQVTQGKPHKKKGKVAIIIAFIVAILCIGAAVLFLLDPFGSASKSRAGAPGQLEGKTAAEIQAELDRQVEEGMFNISIASVAQFSDGTSEGELRIENVPGNRYLMQVTIALDATDQTIYESGIIEPDHHIQKDALMVDLDPGTYDATATFIALDPQTEEEVGRAAAKMLIQVMG